MVDFEIVYNGHKILVRTKNYNIVVGCSHWDLMPNLCDLGYIRRDKYTGNYHFIAD